MGKIDIKQIIEGWTNWLVKNPEMKETAGKRLEICVDCTSNSTYPELKVFSYCELCSCPLVSKTAARDSKCPDKKW